MEIAVKQIFIALMVLSNFAYTQDFKMPESAVFDPVAKRYFVSNYGDGSIIQIDSTGVKSYFKQDLSKPLGMILCENTLYVVDNPKTIRGFNISDGTPALEVQINEARFLNDITRDTSGYLYVTDSNANTIFKINITTGSYSLFVKTKSGNPNGIIYDILNNRLLVCHFKEKATIDVLCLGDSSRSTIVSTELDNLDGLAMDASGNIYVSSWAKGSFAAGFTRQGTIYRYDNFFKNAPVVVTTGYFGPADIYFNIVKKELVIPLFLDQTVEFFRFK